MFPHMFKKRAQEESSASTDGAQVGKRPGQTVAPAGNSFGSAKTRQKVEVSVSEQTVARGLGISSEAYAREKARLQKERDAGNE